MNTKHTKKRFDTDYTDSSQLAEFAYNAGLFFRRDFSLFIQPSAFSLGGNPCRAA
jgi:hypothetical protein